MGDSAVILVVDDEVGITKVFDQILPYRVETAHSGEEALRKMTATIDVVLLDRKMPDLSGDEVLEELRNRGHDQPVVLVTAMQPTPTAATLQYYEYLVKPVRSDKLQSTVDGALALSDHHLQIQEYYTLVDKILALEEVHPLSQSGQHEAVLTHLWDRLFDLQRRMDRPIEPFDDPIVMQLWEKWSDVESGNGKNPEPP